MCAAASEPVDAFLARYKPAPGQDWVTLTFAQSSDGKIAGENSQTVRISGDASMALTHRYVLGQRKCKEAIALT